MHKAGVAHILHYAEPGLCRLSLNCAVKVLYIFTKREATLLKPFIKNDC